MSISLNSIKYWLHSIYCKHLYINYRMTEHTVIPFYNEALFRIYFEQYKSETISENIGEDYICDDYLIASNDLAEELLEKIRALGYSITFSLHTEDSECYGLDVEPDDPSLYFSNAINVVLDGHVRVKIMGLNDRLGPRFIVTSTLEERPSMDTTSTFRS